MNGQDISFFKSARQSTDEKCEKNVIHSYNNKNNNTPFKTTINL